MTSTSSTTPPAAGSPAPSTRPAGSTPPVVIAAGDVVLVRLDESVRRPMIVTAVVRAVIHERATPTVAEASHEELRVSGTIFCDPEDHSTPAIRSTGTHGDPARIHGRPDRFTPFVYGECLKPGMGIGEWIKKPANLPAGR